MKDKIWDILGELRFFIGIIVIIGLFYSCSNREDQRLQEKLDYEYQKGYEQGYYDGENGIEYNP